MTHKQVEHNTGFAKGAWPLTYLGAPIAPGRMFATYFRPLIEKVANRINGWTSRALSMSGRLVLLKHVLSSIPVHILAVMKVPISILNRIDKLMCDFL